MILPPNVIAALIRFDIAAVALGESLQKGASGPATAAYNTYRTAKDNLERAIERSIQKWSTRYRPI